MVSVTKPLPDLRLIAKRLLRDHNQVVSAMIRNRGISISLYRTQPLLYLGVTSYLLRVLSIEMLVRRYIGLSRNTR